MVDPQAPQDRRVQIVDVHRVGGDVVAVVVGLAERDPADAAAGHPDRERTRMMIAAVVVGRQLALGYGSSEFTGPDDQCVVQQARSFKS